MDMPTKRPIVGQEKMYSVVIHTVQQRICAVDTVYFRFFHGKRSEIQVVDIH